MRRKRNIQAFTDAHGVVHPIRSSQDYDSEQLGSTDFSFGESKAAKVRRRQSEERKRHEKASRERKRDRRRGRAAWESVGEDDRPSLAQFVRRHGGIRPTGMYKGEIERLSPKESGSSGLISRDSKRGEIAEYMRDYAAQDGLIHSEMSIGDFLEAVEQSARQRNPMRKKTTKKAAPTKRRKRNFTIKATGRLKVNPARKRARKASTKKPRKTNYTHQRLYGRAKHTSKGWLLAGKHYPVGQGTQQLSGGRELDLKTGIVFKKKEVNPKRKTTRRTPAAKKVVTRSRRNPKVKPSSKKRSLVTLKAGGSLKINPARKRRVKRRNTGAGQFEKFQGRSPVRADVLNMPTGTPAGIDKLGKLVSIQTATGKIVPATLTWLCADSKGKLHLATKAERLIDGPAQSFGKVSRIEYETAKTHLGGGPTVYFHRFGEDDGRQPELVSDGQGGLKFRGGAYRITAAGIVN